MTLEQLEQIAQQAMDYLDSVGVAADYGISEDGCLHIEVDNCNQQVATLREWLELKCWFDITVRKESRPIPAN